MERHIDATRRALFILCLLPLAYYGQGFWQDALGANHIEAVARGFGNWALQLLLITLAVTPLRRLTGWAWLLKLRRTLGLFTFFYACLHLTTYLWLDQSFDWSVIGKDFVKRPFIAAGLVAFALLVPLAITSSNAMVRRLGGRRWRELHRLIYPLAMIAVLHGTWMVKVDIGQPAVYGLILAVLLALRLRWYWQDLRRQSPAGPAAYPRLKGRVIPIIPRR